ncbi:MAG: PQQ-binding-like beta-propeller repeat protein [Bacteroidia bacterium]|nr:PQQ-binding-like beta-propeller repeat protein [Bacteroidia bacterium]
MKRSILHFLIAGSILLLYSCASTTFQSLWKTKFDHKIDMLSSSSNNGDRVVGSSQKEVTLLDGEKGSIKWTGKYKDLNPEMKKTDEHFAMWDANVLFVFDRKVGEDKMACFDINNGKLLWKTSKYQNVTVDNLIYFPELETFAISLKASIVMIKAKTGEEMWETDKFKGSVGRYIYLKDQNRLVMINYKPSTLAALFSGFKNQLVCINVTNGDIVWEATYRGAVERKIVTKEPVLNLYVKNDKVFLSLNGLQVYDLKTGQNLWSAAFDETPGVVPAPLGCIAFGAYDIVAEPLVIGNDVYVVDFQNKRNQFIKKYDLNTGSLKWTSEELKDVRIAPRIYVVEGKIIIQVGGLANRQYIKRERRSCGQNCYYYVTVSYNDYKWIKPFGVMALDAETGKFVWRSEKFKQRVTNMLADDKFVYVASTTALLALNPKDGAAKYETILKTDKVGKPFYIYEKDGNVVLACDKGMSSHKMSDGTTAWATPFKTGTIFTKKSEYVKRYGDVVFLRNKKWVLGGFDMKTGKFLGQACLRGTTYEMAPDGSYMFQYFSRSAQRLKIK